MTALTNLNSGSLDDVLSDVRCAVVGPATEHDDVEVHRTLLGGDQWLAEDVVHS